MALEAVPWERLECPKSKQAFTQGAWPKTETGGGDEWGRCEGGVGQSSQPKMTGRFEDPRNPVGGTMGVGNGSCSAWILASQATLTAALQAWVSVGEPGEGTV